MVLPLCNLRRVVRMVRTEGPNGERRARALSQTASPLFQLVSAHMTEDAMIKYFPTGH